MDHFYKSCVETDLASLHYVTFVEPLTVLPTEALSFDSNEFMNNSINKLIQEEKKNPFLLPMNILSPRFWCTKKYEVQFEELSYKVLRVLLINLKLLLKYLFVTRFTTSSYSFRLVVIYQDYFNNFDRRNVYTLNLYETKVIYPGVSN
jgi:hypothetical protein